MISSVRGQLASRSGDRVVLATSGGISYEITVPIGVLERLPADGATVELRTVLVVREDGWALYGFDQELERAVFQRLLTATGVGPRLALALVSALGGPRVVSALRESDLGVLSTVPGIGKKTAERLVVELKDKVRDLAAVGAGAGAPRERIPAAEQAVQALMGLGYPVAEADRAVRAILTHDGAGEPVDLIRRALKLLAGER